MVISFVIYIMIGYFISRKIKDANDFYVAGRNAPLLLIIGSMIASYVSTGMFMGDAGEYYKGIFSPMTILATMQVAGYILGAVFFGRYLRRAKVFTIPEYFGIRFCSEKLRVLSTITAIITMTVYLLSVVQGVGTLMHVVTGLNYKLCVLLAIIVFSIVTISSGSKGVLITDTLMFSIFTIALIAAVFVITKKCGGWYSAVRQLKSFDIKDLLSWHGNLDYMYSKGQDNVIWGIVYGIVWLSVCMVGPWQSSRYLMAKNEHTVIRSSVFSAFGIFLLQLLVGIAAVTVNLCCPELEDQSHVLIWASMNILPTFLGVLLLTGVLAAGISSATTFLSLIGASFGNDIYKKKEKSVVVSRISMGVVSFVVLLLAVFNPPQIFWIMYFGGAIVASSWMPVALASILSKRITKAGAFVGMLTGFCSCFLLKLYSNICNITLPVIFDPVIVGIISNIIGIFIGSVFTKVTPDELQATQKLFIVPEEDKKITDISRTLKYMKFAPGLGILIFLILFFVWVIPYNFIK
ncbi:sodium:solute symporter family protein [uncultured Treponema sp.]|uniref:sodium:solute symporter family protein n=1 Tax=uncultured Treponema sp. TaxID=162155 RepID=UPI0025D82853|nr:sodium:solute symporter family protein [uncultured Treponema sp.]